MTAFDDNLEKDVELIGKDEKNGKQSGEPPEQTDHREKGHVLEDVGNGLLELGDEILAVA